MGGGAVIRSTAKVGLGLGAIGSYRGITPSPVPLAERVVTALNSAIPASAVSNSNQQQQQEELRNTSTAFISSHQYDSTTLSSLSSVHRTSWEVNDWEFISEEDDHVERILDLIDDPTRIRPVFGSVPSLEEAEAATYDLKEALEKIYFSPGTGTGTDEDVQGFGLPRPYINYDRSVTFPSKPKHAFQAFWLLRDSSEVQNVVASLASDKNVWEAVMKNEEVAEFYKKANKNLSVSTPGVRVERNTKDGSSADGLISLMEMIKEKVLAMVSSLLEFLQNIFRNPTEGSDSGNSIWKCTSSTGAPFMALTIAAIMVVMVKRA